MDSMVMKEGYGHTNRHMINKKNGNWKILDHTDVVLSCVVLL